jgi:hypothetical protein
MSPSQDANTDLGFTEINRRLRSVLMSPVAVVLVDYLNGEGDDDIRQLFNAFVIVLDKEWTRCSSFKGEFRDCFSNCYTQWKTPSTPNASLRISPLRKTSPPPQKKPKEGTALNEPSTQNEPIAPNEKALTKLLAEKLNETLLKGTVLYADDQFPVRYDDGKVVKGANKKPAKIDLLVYHGDRDNAKDAVLLLEVGFESDVDGWWRKASQAVDYAGCLKKHRPKVFSKNMMCAILTVDKASNLDFKSAKLGVFLCKPTTMTAASGLDFRMSLLWHAECTSLKMLSEAIGKLVRGARALPALDEKLWEPNKYEYLGPNCCRVDMVVRCVISCMQTCYGCIILIL